MVDSNQSQTVLVITEDVELLSSLIESNTTDFQFISREVMQAALEDPELLINNDIVILDIDSVNGGTDAVIEQALNLKKSDPTQVLMLVGDSEPLAEILRSNIQPLIYRAFNKPIHPNQIFLSFGSASKLHQSLIEKQAAGEDLLSIGPVENRTNVDSIAGQQKNKTAIYAGVGILVLGIIAFLFLGDSDQDKNVIPSIDTSTSTQIDDSLVNTNDDVSNINTLNQEAAKALLEGRQISPPGDNALDYYDQVLAIDPYDFTAYEGKKALAAELKSNYPYLIKTAQFDKALDSIKALQRIEPLNSANYDLRESLEVAINKHVDKVKSSGTAEQIDRTTAVLEKIGPELKGSQTAAAALQQEKVLLDSIDEAIEEGNLIPPQTGNAYAIVSEALQKNTISKVNFAPRLSALSDKLVNAANGALEKDDLEEAEKLTALIKRLNVDSVNLGRLNTKINAKKEALAAESEDNTGETDEADEQVVIKPAAPAKIIPAKIISRSAPRYPSRAIRDGIEGWVSIGFTIDTKGVPRDIKVVDSEPGSTFDKAAIAAVKKWRFSPAINENTRLPVSSVVDSTKLEFKLQ